MLKSVLSGEQCARCRICCSFVKEDVWEAPTLVHPDTNEKYRAEYNFKNSNEILLCPMLDEKTGCTLGEKKPFECKIWPLRAFNIEGNIRIGISDICPAFTREDDVKMIKLLDDGLYEEILRECKKSPELVRTYDKEYRIIK